MHMVYLVKCKSVIVYTENKILSIWHFVVTAGTLSCNDNLRCHQWRQICQIDDVLL